MTEKSGFAFAPGMQQTVMTLPNEALCHYITDDELERLSEMKKEPVMEIFLASIGVFFGALLPALQGLSKLIATPPAMTNLDMFTMAIALFAFGVAAVTGYLWYARAKAHKSMAETIRARPRVTVGVA